MRRHDRYPRLGASKKLELKHGKPKCECCGKPRTHLIEIQVDWFRGDDDVFVVCEAHLQMAREAKWDQFYEDHHYTKKETGNVTRSQ